MGYGGRTVQVNDAPGALLREGTYPAEEEATSATHAALEGAVRVSEQGFASGHPGVPDPETEGPELGAEGQLEQIVGRRERTRRQTSGHHAVTQTFHCASLDRKFGCTEKNSYLLHIQLHLIAKDGQWGKLGMAQSAPTPPPQQKMDVEPKPAGSNQHYGRGEK